MVGLSQLMAELTVSPSHVPAMTQIALEYRRRGDGEKALSYAEQVVKINPQNEKAQFVMGRTLIDLGRLTDGIEHLRRALALAPSDHATLWALSLAETKSGNEREAQRLRLMKNKIKTGLFMRLNITTVMPAAPA